MVSNNKSITVNNSSKIYIMAPSGIATGGPEALHQLAYILKDSLKLDVSIYYLPPGKDKPIHKNYKDYHLKFVEIVEDSPHNILVIPEYFKFLIEAKKFKNIQKIIWWLSIDNYFGYRFRYKNLKFIRSIIKLPFNLISFFNFITLNIFGHYTIEDYLKFIYGFTILKKHRELLQGNLHLAQSEYAYRFLLGKINNINILSDYTRDDFIKNINYQKNEKENCICYNPNKSNTFMEKVIKDNRKIKFIPLIGLDKNEVINSLKKSKIYFDIGSHPGKDRMPREAALLGNCIITNRKGSAENSKDIPIPEEFKFYENYFNLKKIKNKINLIFNNYENEFKKFESYVNIIMLEKENFVTESKNIFHK